MEGLTNKFFVFLIVAIYGRSLNTSRFSHGERAAINKQLVYACYCTWCAETVMFVSC